MNIEKEIGEGSEAVYAYYFESQCVGERWPIKIGKATDPIRRIKTQQASMQEKPIIALIFWTNNSFWSEQEVHVCLNKNKLPTFGREWFNTNTDELIEILLKSSRTGGDVTRDRRSLGARLRRYRVQANLTQGQLSDKVGLRVATISSIENGGPVKLETIFRVMSAMNLEFVVQPRQRREYIE